MSKEKKKEQGKGQSRDSVSLASPSVTFSLPEMTSEPTMVLGLCLSNLRLSEKEYQLLGNDLKSSIKEAIMETIVESGWDKDEPLAFHFVLSFPKDETLVH